MRSYHFSAELWRVPTGAWHFVTLPFEIADEIDEAAPRPGAGFGAVRVEVTVGTSTWRTSVFPDSKASSYVLPVKRAIRTAEHLVTGRPVEVALVLVVDE